MSDTKRTIDQALADCKKHWAPHAQSWQGRYAWNIHHRVALELLTEPPQNRIDFIVSDKDPSEQVARLDSFRIFTGKIPQELEEANARLADASTSLAAAREDFADARAKFADARAKLDDARAKWANSPGGMAQRLLDAPLSHWNGKNLGF